MLNLRVSDAVAAVRKNLDEQEWNPSQMFEDVDNAELDSMIANTIAEAIRSVHASAPDSIMEGVVLDNTANLDIDVEDHVLDINFKTTGSAAPINDMYRLISFKCSDSDIVLTTPVYEESPQARAQLNKYVRGTKDNPVLVLMADNPGMAPHYRYYTTDATASTVKFRLEYFPDPVKKTSSGQDYYEIATRLYDATIYMLTSMVLSIYGEAEKAQYFLQKATTQL